ncbi:right-handed parallel beta-helix repeat-containing protein [Intrasporangium flavum]|uniref:right-handed parallel beta-helix repeat-containing protein n=1 Tax=Intrasporangium flavum TaxID=1428657 RepID=UPI0009F871C1|nr:right-handed parallel beta-helix repeat-containing protein [Intrasporangium flavum]
MAAASAHGTGSSARGKVAFATGVLGVALGLAALPLDPAEGAVTTLYVGGAGCSDAGTGTASVPYCTIAKAAKVAVAGQTVLVSSGTYADEVFPWHSGTSGSPIVFRPAPGASVTISGAKHGFTISNQSWITVSGFTIQGSPRDGIYVYNATGVTLTGNTVRTSGLRVSGSTAYGMYLNAMTGSSVSGNLVTDNSASGIFLTNGSTGNQLVGNEISWNAYGYVRNAVGIDLRAPGNLVKGNRVHDNEDSGIQSYPGGDGNTIVDNVSYHNMGFTSTVQSNCSHPPTGNTDGCLTGDHGIDDFGVTGSSVVGNTVYGNVSAGINLEGVASGTPTGFTIADNVAVDNAIGCPDGAGGTFKCPRTRGNIRVDATSQLGTTVDSDLVNLSTAGTMLVWGSTSYTSLSAFQAASGQEDRGLQADPRLTNPAGGDLTLQAGSPAIDSADSSAPGQPATDAAGRPRVDDPATADTGIGVRTYDDRGAYEYQPTTPTGGTP